MSSSGTRIQFQVHFECRPRGRKSLREGPPPLAPSPGRVPRVTRLMALAIRFDGLIREKEVRDLAEIARLGMVTRARVTQIMNMLHLAPDIQDAILFMPSVEVGRDPIVERDIRPIVGIVEWNRQRAAWRELVARAAASQSPA